MLVFFTNLFLHFPVIDGCRQFWVGSLLKNIQLMLEFLKAPFLVYYTLKTFLIMLSVILLSVLMIAGPNLEN